jgi:indolepyruvate ferredoxin oxidoreductase, alpha subunit
MSERMLLSGNEAIALAARDAGVALGTGYPGTPSTEILERFAELGGRAQWAPNEKVAYEVAMGAAFGRARALVTMKHVGVNVAADPLFTTAYSGVQGALVLVSADDPGMFSSQNEQDNRRYAVAAGVPMLEPADSQEAYDYTLLAFEVSERWHLPVMLRVTTRVCHSKGVVQPRAERIAPAPAGFERDIKGRVMIPAHARPAHRRLRAKLAEILAWNEASGPNCRLDGDRALGIIASGAVALYAQEAAPTASVLKLGMAHPLPIETIRAFAASVERCVVLEEGDPYLLDAIRAAGVRTGGPRAAETPGSRTGKMPVPQHTGETPVPQGVEVEGKSEMYRFGELHVARVRRILAGDVSEEAAPPRAKPPELCKGCPHRASFEVLRKLNCIVSGDIGCYTLAALPPLEAMDSQTCMGASIGAGLGLRHVLPSEQARRVVSVIGDSTFVHSGITGLVEMVYNPPSTGHLVVILDNGTTAMTGLQEHAGTGRKLDHQPTNRISFEDLARSLGIQRVFVTDPMQDGAGFEKLVKESLGCGELTVIIARRPCVLAAGKIRQYEISNQGSEMPKQSEISNQQSAIPAATAQCEACEGAAE